MEHSITRHPLYQWAREQLDKLGDGPEELFYNFTLPPFLHLDIEYNSPFESESIRTLAEEIAKAQIAFREGFNRLSAEYYALARVVISPYSTELSEAWLRVPEHDLYLDRIINSRPFTAFVAEVNSASFRLLMTGPLGPFKRAMASARETC